MSTPNDAIREFKTSSRFPSAAGLTRWEIRNDYPAKSNEPEPKWYNINFKDHPKEFLEAVKEYILQGNVKSKLVVQNNKERNWYHAPWRHYGDNGREPLNGLNWGDPRRLSDNLGRKVQIWGNGYFNEPAATLLHNIWGKDGSNPKWDGHLQFPDKSFIFMAVFTDATGNELPILKHAPVFEACIAKGGGDDPKQREDTPRQLRLCQIEFCARTGTHTDIGWVFGAFIFDGRNPSVEDTWKIVPIGLQWGSDPTLIRTEQDNEKCLKETWHDEDTVDLIKEYYHFESRPVKGWHGRLVGVIDDFMSACASCHAAAQFTPEYPFRNPTPLIQSPQPVKIGDQWVQQYDGVEKIWFRNIAPGSSFDKDSLSSDYVYGVQIGYTNYLHWKAKENKPAGLPPLSGTLLASYSF